MKTTAWDRVFHEVRDFRSRIRELPVVPPGDVGLLRERIRQAFPFTGPMDLAELVSQTAELLRHGTVHVTHPRYFGLFNPSVREAGILGDTLTAAFNPQLAVWSHAPAAQELEQHVLRCLAGVIGFQADHVLANFTTGGTEANLTAVLAAMITANPEYATRGVRAFSRRPGVYVSSQSHDSFVKIARMTGLGTDALRQVGTTPDLVMDPGNLRDRLRADMADGWAPLMVVATAGSTAAGTIDPIAAIQQVVADFGVWCHVDAAWGAAALIVPELRPLFRGIELADSVTWDAHKWLSVPMGAGMLFCKYPDALRRAFDVNATYMPPSAVGDAIDPYLVTPQWSRRAIGVKLFMALGEIGLEGYENLIRHQTEMGDSLRSRLLQAGWVVVNTTPLPVVCFSHPVIRDGRTTTAEILATLHKRGRVWISDVDLPDHGEVLRACITSYDTTHEDLIVLVDELDAALGETRSGNIHVRR